MFKSYRFRIYPNTDQRRQLADNFGCSRFVFNRLVEQRADRGPVSRVLEQHMIDQFKQDQPWIKDINPSVVYHTFDNFNHSFQRSKELNRKLRFKTATGRETFCLSNYSRAIQINPRSVAVRAIGDLRARMPRLPDGRIMNITVIKAGSGRYYMSVLVQQTDSTAESLNQKEKIRCIGLDMGIRHFLTQSDGTHIENPKYFEEDLQKLKRMQKSMSRKVRGSANYNKQRQRNARLHERIVSRRNAFLHKESTRIVRDYDIIAVETLGISDMLEHRQLSLKISDAAWNTFIKMLTYKSRWYGKQLIQIDRYHPSSKTCCKCHYKIEEMPLHLRDWQCPQCETPHDRDTNAAINIMIEGVKIYLKSNPSVKKKLVPVLSDRR